MNALSKCQKPSRLAYNALVAKKASPPTHSQYKWTEACCLPQNGVNWTDVYQLASKITGSTKPREFQFKLLHRRLSTNDFLTKIQIKENPRCFFCNVEREKLINTPFLELPYNIIFLGKRNSAPKGFPGCSKRFFLRYCSSNWFEACFFKVTSTSKFLPSYSQALLLAL